MLFSRRPPARVRAMLARDERALAWAAAGPSDFVVATNLGLWLPGRTERLGWHQIHKATWDPPRLTVIPSTPVEEAEGYAIMADDAAVEIVLSDPGDVPIRVRERVTRSVAYTRHHPLPPSGGVRVVGRRVPGADGLSWHVRYDEGTDREDPEVRAATAELVGATSTSLRVEQRDLSSG
jgi:hypothetical protein